MTMTEGMAPNTQESSDQVGKEDLRADYLDSPLQTEQPPAEITTTDQADLKKLADSPEAPVELDDRQQKIAVARETAAQASEAMDNLAPGSQAEKDNLMAMRAARRAGQSTVEGLTTEAPADEAVPKAQPTGEKKSWLQRLLRR